MGQVVDVKRWSTWKFYCWYGLIFTWEYLIDRILDLYCGKSIIQESQLPFSNRGNISSRIVVTVERRSTKRLQDQEDFFIVGFSIKVVICFG